MGKQKFTRAKRELKHTILCDWCGQHKETSREDTKTCSGTCRQRLAFYTRSLGYAPDGIPGPVTAQQAIDLEVFRLITNEQRRRAAAAAERKAYLARKEA